jgi:hypothetical protein
MVEVYLNNAAISKHSSFQHVLLKKGYMGYPAFLLLWQGKRPRATPAPSL